jgi:heat shock protein HtpX
LYEQIGQNKRRTIVLMAVFILFVALVVGAFNLVVGGGVIGFILAVGFAGTMGFIGYWKSDQVALKMSRAVPADPREYARLHNLVEGLCIAGGLPKPRIYVIDDHAPNAFATGRNPEHAAIAVTTGLLEKMNRVELEGVLAHELSHIKNYDILVSTLAVTMVGAVALLADFAIRFMWWGGGRSYDDNRDNNGGAGNVLAIFGFALLIFSPLIAQLLQFAVSRNREELADVSGVGLTRYPPGLISALEKLRDDETVVHSSSRATAHLWIEQPTARQPSEGKLSQFNRMFDTHPPLDERIERLREL